MKRYRNWLGLLSALLLTAVFAVGCFFLTACGDASQPDGPDAQGAWEYFTHSYTNQEGAAATMEYALYIPASYTAGDSLPLITYIPDASYVGQTAQSVTKAAGPVNWAKEDKMSGNPAFFLVFSFKETASDIYTEGSEGSQIVPIIDKVVEAYGMDAARLYLTGQSMGGITDFALNDEYPDKFAATVYVGCQPGDEVEDDQYNAVIASAKFADQKFVYIASRKDQKAPFGQDAVQAALDEKGASYDLLYDLDHTDTAALNAQIKAELDKGYERYFFGYTQLTASGDGVAEHMQSFKYAYQLDAIFEWLLAQRLDSAVSEG